MKTWWPTIEDGKPRMGSGIEGAVWVLLSDAEAEIDKARREGRDEVLQHRLAEHDMLLRLVLIVPDTPSAVIQLKFTTEAQRHRSSPPLCLRGSVVRVRPTVPTAPVARRMRKPSVS